MKQVRGPDLQKRIEEVIRDLASIAKRNGKKYIYSASEVARIVPTTRKTLRHHDETISRVLNDLNSRRRMSTGAAGMEQLRDEVAGLKDQLKEQKRIIAALRGHHVEIYTRLHQHSLDGEVLVRPIMELESREAEHCVLCGSPLPAKARVARSTNVTPLRAARKTPT